MNLAHTLLRTASRLPEVCAVDALDSRRLTYAQLAGRVLRLAASLRAQCGVAPGQTVALVMQNHPAYVELLYACWACGASAIPINAKLHPREVAFILEDAQARACFVGAAIDAGAIESACATRATRFIDVDSPAYSALLDNSPASLHAVEADDVAWLFYTSGTTGRPKGVMLTHRNLLAMALNYLADVDPAAPGDVLLHAAPMSHGSGLYIVPNIATGATHMVPASRAFDVDEIDAILATSERVKFFGAPTMVMRLTDRLRGDARGLKSIVYGGGPMYVADCQRALARFGPRLTQIYGQGESPMTITVLPAHDHVDTGDGRWQQRLGSVGRAQTGIELSVFDREDRPLPTGEAGEVCVRGDTVMRGYLNRDDATVVTLAGGWLHTGDIGRLDEHGYLTLVDRSKDLIVSGGSNIYPREVEEVLLQHAQVAEVAVIGVPDAEWGESVLAFVVARGARPATEALDELCVQQIARFKRPKRYVFVDDLPKNAAGKVLKRELRERVVSRGNARGSAGAASGDGDGGADADAPTGR